MIIKMSIIQKYNNQFNNQYSIFYKINLDYKNINEFIIENNILNE